MHARETRFSIVPNDNILRLLLLLFLAIFVSLALKRY